MPSKVWDKITHPLPNSNGVAVEVWEWISYFIPHCTGHVVIYPLSMLGLKLICVNERDPRNSGGINQVSGDKLHQHGWKWWLAFWRNVPFPVLSANQNQLIIQFHCNFRIFFFFKFLVLKKASWLWHSMQSWRPKGHKDTCQNGYKLKFQIL